MSDRIEPESVHTGTRDVAVVLAASILIAGIMASIGITAPGIHNLDAAHHWMDGIFFADMVREGGYLDPISFTFDYYRQYPALGFKFWPPLFPVTEAPFFLAIGQDVVHARIVVLLWTCLLAAATAYLILTTTQSVFWSLAAAVAILTIPSLFELMHQVMLEIPVLAVGMVSLVLYERIIRDGEWRSWLQVAGIALLLTAALYTKQTIAFLLLAICIDTAFRRPRLFARRATWVAGIGVVIGTLPLAIFTLTYGIENVAQSLGQHGDLYGIGTKVADRWTLASWTYYPRQLPNLLHPLWLIGAALGAVFCIVSREARNRWGIWLWWSLAWYIQFSIFDNKQPRYASLALPGIVLLAVGAFWQIRAWVPRLREVAVILVASALLLQVYPLRGWQPHRFTGMEEIVRQILDMDPGNISYWGYSRQLFVPYVRNLDGTRSVMVYQGDDIERVSGSVERALHDYQVRWCLVETDIAWTTEPSDELALVATLQFEFPGRPKSINLWRYDGPVAPVAAEVPLRADFQLERSAQ